MRDARVGMRDGPERVVAEGHTYCLIVIDAEWAEENAGDTKSRIPHLASCRCFITVLKCQWCQMNFHFFFNYRNYSTDFLPQKNAGITKKVSSDWVL